MSRHLVQRNDVLALVIELMLIFPKADFIASGLAEGIFLYDFNMVLDL